MVTSHVIISKKRLRDILVVKSVIEDSGRILPLLLNYVPTALNYVQIGRKYVKARLLYFKKF